VAKLNGWKRLGIIASVVWILGAWVHTIDSENDSESKAVASIHVTCDDNLAGKTGDAWQKGFDECNKEADDLLTHAMAGARVDAAIVAFVPVPLGWGLAYLVLFLVRWVKRGFARPI
jgi:hypothetical protein